LEKLHNDELHNLYTPPNNIRVSVSRNIRWAVRIELFEIGNLYQIFNLKLKERNPLGKVGLDERINIKTDNGEIRSEDVNWINLVHSRFL
jgi:hypothetical protein